MVTGERAPVAAAPGRTGLGLTRRASLNAVASGLDYGVRAAVELIVTPLVVAGLGAAVYGAWRVLWQWSSYVWGASGRSAQALQFAIANKQWTASGREKRQFVGAAAVVWLIFLPLLILAGALGVWLAPTILDMPEAQVVPVRVAAAILTIDAMAVTLLTLPRSSLQGENLGYTRMGLSAGLVAIGGALMAGAAAFDLGLPGLAGAVLVTTLLTGITFWWISRRRLEWFGIDRPTRATVRWFLGLSAWFLGWKFVLELMIASDVLVLALFTSVSVVASFALTKWVADAMAQALGLLVQASIPGIGGYVGAGDLPKAAVLRGEVVSLVWLVGTATGTTVVLWNNSFVDLWVGGRLFAGVTPTLLVVVLALQMALIRTDTLIIDVALIPRIKVIGGAVSAAASILLASLGAWLLDDEVLGLCLGLVLGRSILGVVAPRTVGRLLGLPAATQLRAVIRPALASGLVLGAAWWVAGQNAAGTWPGLVVGAALTMVVAGVALLLLGLSRGQRARLVQRAKAVAADVGGRRP